MAFAEFPLLLDLHGTDRGKAAVGSYTTICICPPTQSRGQESRCGRHCNKDTNTLRIMRYSEVQRQCWPRSSRDGNRFVSCTTLRGKRPSCHIFCFSLHEAQFDADQCQNRYLITFKQLLSNFVSL